MPTRVLSAAMEFCLLPPSYQYHRMGPKFVIVARCFNSWYACWRPPPMYSRTAHCDTCFSRAGFKIVVIAASVYVS